jgi:predicted permease
LTAVIEIVLPVFAIILLGYGFGRGGFLSAEGARGLGAFVYYAAIPAVLFRGMAGATAGIGGSLGLIGAYFAGALAIFAASMAVGRIGFGLSLAEQGLMALSTGFSNSVQLGIPLVLAAFGDAGLVPLTIIISVHSLVLLSLATAVVEAGRGHAGGALRMAEATAIAIVSNPVILSIVAGFLWRITGLAIPRPIQHLIDLLAGAATPAALFSLGATIAGFRLAGDLAESLVVVAIKLLVLPIVVWLLAARVFHLSALDTAVAITCAALPTGANAFILAQRYDLYVARAASSVLISTVLSVFTLGALLAVLAPAR